ncbi:MAG: acetyl-CoA C-acyltransferase FadI [Longimicrobiales bacterium]
MMADRRVAIVAGCRTPFAKSGSAFKNLTAIDLGIVAVRELISRANLDVTQVNELIYGTVVHSVTAPNIAREVGLGAGLSPQVPAYTVSRACASANQAITNAADSIARGYSDIVIAGGAEVLSDIPILLGRKMRNALVAASRSKSLGGKARALAALRPRDLAPITPAIAEPTTGESMGQSAERMAKENGIPREAQDKWSLRSHQLAAQGTKDGRLTAETVPTYVHPDYTEMLDRDNGIRPDSSLEKLAQLPPVFDRKYGSVTAGNSSPLTDGASAVLLMSEEKAKGLGYQPLGYVRSYAYSALAPSAQLLQGPAYAAPLALQRAGINMRDVELMEMHEAFAAQVLSNLQALDSTEFARRELNRSTKIGIPEEARINVMGGSIAIGHPFGATGARLTITLLNELKRRNANLGLITVCAAGALGFAMVVSRE